MSDISSTWFTAGQGTRPRAQWSLTIDAPLTGLQWARETGDVLASDTSGGLYRIDSQGRLVMLSRGFLSIDGLAWSDVGNRAAAVVAENQLCCIDRKLKVEWAIEFSEVITAIGIDAHGDYLGVSLANGQNVVYDVNRQQICRFETARPLCFLQFLVTQPALIGAAEYGLICRYDFEGREIWSEKLLSNIGDLSLTCDASTLFAAVFNHGVRMLAADGSPCGSYMIEGTASRLAASYDAGRLVIVTLEGHIYWLDADGEIVWAAGLPEEIERVCCDPLGTSLLCGFRSGRLTNLVWE